MELISTNYFSIWILLLVLLFSSTILPHCDARKTMLQPKRSSFLGKNHKRLKIRKHLTMDDVSIMDSSNTQPYVNSPFSWPPFDSLPPENSPPFCIYPPPTTPSTNPTTPSGPSPTPSGPSPITPILPSPISPTVPVPSPPESGFSPNPPGSGINPSPPDSGLRPSPPESGFSPNPPQSGMSPSPPDSGLNPSPPESGLIPSPPYIEPSPPAGNPPSTPTPSTPIYTPSPPSIFVPSPPIFQPPVVYPPPLVPPPRSGGAIGALWCVVKPAVPDPIIQEAMNYACASGADCGPIQSGGPCYTPNNLFAHASFAFNSYWQRTKVAGGTCSFGGTAILVTVDPSHEQCHFDYF